MAYIFKVGDVVRLTSSPTRMTVSDIIDREGFDYCHCQWFDELDHLQEGTFGIESLILENIT